MTTKTKTKVDRELILPDGRTQTIPAGTVEVLRYGRDVVDAPLDEDAPNVSQSMRIMQGVVAALEKLPVWQWLQSQIAADNLDADRARQVKQVRERLAPAPADPPVTPANQQAERTSIQFSMPSHAVRQRYARQAVDECDRRRRRGEEITFEESLALVCGSREKAQRLLAIEEGPGPRGIGHGPSPRHPKPGTQGQPLPDPPLTKQERHAAAQALLDEVKKIKYSRGEEAIRPKPRTQARCDEAAKFAADHGLGFEEALEIMDAVA